MELSVKHQEYWRKNLVITAILLGIWFIATFIVGWTARELNSINFLGFPLCRARMNKDGKLYSLVYGKPCAVHVDPIEKKPFFHFLPGTNAFSIATRMCPQLQVLPELADIPGKAGGH